MPVNVVGPNHNMKPKRTSWVLCGIVLAVSCRITVATLIQEPFADDDGGWRATGVDAFLYDVGLGALRAEMTDSGLFPKFGAFTADSSSSDGNLTGDYLLMGAEEVTVQSVRFDFRSTVVAPSSLSLVLSGAGHHCLYSFAVDDSIDVWKTYEAALIWDQGWSGGTAQDFSAMLRAVDHIQVQFTSQGQMDQAYLLDDFTLVPEPGTTALMLLGGFLTLARGWMMRRRSFSA